jgi:hypothetical protein
MKKASARRIENGAGRVIKRRRNNAGKRHNVQAFASALK